MAVNEVNESGEGCRVLKEGLGEIRMNFGLLHRNNLTLQFPFDQVINVDQIGDRDTL